MSGALVSIILSVCDVRAFLAPALTSILAQDHVRAKAIVVDEESRDGSGRFVAGSFRDATEALAGAYNQRQTTDRLDAETESFNVALQNLFRSKPTQSALSAARGAIDAPGVLSRVVEH
jgi:hypothetical protein